jgi:hypothetical protein
VAAAQGSVAATQCVHGEEVTRLTHAPDRYLVGTDVLARVISTESGSVETVELVRREAGARIPSSGHKLELVIDTARWRYDNPHWRWRKRGGGGEESGYHRSDFDDSGWDARLKGTEV